MRITGFTAENWLCHRFLAVKLSPLSLICGPNGVGKSSTLDGISFILSAELRRITAKGDREKLITEGQDKGKVTLHAGAASVSKDVATGKLGKATAPLPIAPGAVTAAIPYVLDSARFARETDEERRVALLAIMGVKVDAQAIHAELEAKGFDTKQMGARFPITAPIEKWHEEAKKLVSENAGLWRGVTGEAYGKNKAAEWAPASPQYPDPAALEDAQALWREKKRNVEVLQQTLGALRAGGAQVTVIEPDVLARAERAPALKDVLATQQDGHALAKVTLQKATETLAEIATRIPSNHLNCPCCAAPVVVRADGPDQTIERFQAPERPATPAEHAAAKEALFIARDTLERLEAGIERAKADLRIAEAAAETVAMIRLQQRAEAQAAPAGLAEQIEAAERAIEVAKDEVAAAEEVLIALRQQGEQAKQAEENAKKAAGYHAKAETWAAIAAELAPTGIPSTLLTRALDPFNALLVDLAGRFKWPLAQVRADMSITYGGRLYSLRSESEKWRADVMLTVAIAVMTKLRFVGIDRFDVLELKSRGPALQAFYFLVTGDKALLDTCILAGTMKEPPQAPKDVIVTWLGPQAAQPRAAAA